MKIPHSLTLLPTAQTNTVPTIDYFQKTLDQTQHWIPTTEAAALTGRKNSYIIKQIENGKLHGKQDDYHLINQKGETNYSVLLEDLPHAAQYKFFLKQIPEDCYINEDIISPRMKLGQIWEQQLINISELIKQVISIKRTYYNSKQVTQKLKDLATSYGISLATLYRFTSQKPIKKISLLYLDPIYMQDHLPYTMCLRSVDFAYALFLDEHQHYSFEAIFEELNKRANTPCSSCPYNSESASKDHSLWKTPTCKKNCSLMVIPNNAKAISRIVSHIPPSVICYCRDGFRAWRSEFAPFSMRYKPLMVNDNWQGDTHKFNIFVRIKVYQYKNGKRYCKQIAIRPSLTAWMDSATGCIVGWVISVLPNSDTIAEAFCRACTYTLGDKFTSLPHSVITDCGKDFKSALLEDLPEYYLTAVEAEDSFCLNQRFSGLGVLRAFNCDVYHCLPYHPQSKPIERCFSSIENQIEKLPGWCYRNVSDRPAGFQKYLDSMLESEKLYTLEEFSDKFATEILPAYHGQPDHAITNPEIPGWKLDLANMTPMQRYENLTKSRTLIPSYRTISIIKKHFKENLLIQRNGIRFAHVYYDAEELKPLRGQHVDILYFKVSKPYAPSSITVIYQLDQLCEAFPTNANAYTGVATSLLSEISHEQNKQASNIQRAVTNIKKSVSDILPDNTTAESIERFNKTKIGKREQLRNEAYSVPYRDENNESNVDQTYAHEESEFHNEYQSHKTKQTSKISFREGLDYLLGEDDNDYYY